MNHNTQTVNPPQAEILASGILVTGFSCVLQMPTGSGKTWLARNAIGDVLKRGLRAIYLTPLKALAGEVARDWEAHFPDTNIGVFTGDFGRNGQKYPVPFKDAQIMIMTPERLDACTRSWRSHWHWIPEVDLVVVDEFHLLGDRGRGGRLEGAICRLRRLNPFVRFLCLSATLGNRSELARWLGGVEYSSDWRPIELTWSIELFRRASDKPRLLSEVVRRNLGDGGRSLVFVQSRRRAEQLVMHLQDEGIRAGFHHAGLTHDKRQRTEGRFREGELDVLVATATLEMGLNMPARQVVLYDLQQFNGKEFAPLPCRNVWQRGGAGRSPRSRQEGRGRAHGPRMGQGREIVSAGGVRAHPVGPMRPSCPGRTDHCRDQRALCTGRGATPSCVRVQPCRPPEPSGQCRRHGAGDARGRHADRRKRGRGKYGARGNAARDQAWSGGMSAYASSPQPFGNCATF
ncbi:DEAD/DEAH box helicase [uncultured Draconibacterium sp.]|uniref:DEAD/DEAH box helicase n=1 Tax=uncultured Draconibacterium sp. TaxID=1573823 RepID=UPI003748EBD0